ncbi:unnamed protein product [Dovyalis caffra]|uniref:NAC domain-containing protein n=1 Tax=Dovyalis caffra TaxID=77055 RepID=A0AAV1SAX7_9ROSI|nr:unnamed protein product [Dovyalis caffra]
MPSIPAVGYRFHPTNEELIDSYLKPKVLGYEVQGLLILAEVNVCKHEPWDLPVIIIDGDVDISSIKSDDQVWHFLKSDDQGGYVLCKLKKKSNVKTHKREPKHCLASVSNFEAEPSCSMASDFENQNHSELTANSACVESESSHHLASDFENQNSNELMSNSAYDGSGLCHSMTSNYENQHPNEQIVNSAYNGSEQSHPMASDHEKQDPIEMTPMSPFDNLLMASDFDDPLSPLQLEGECDPSLQMPSKLTSYSTYGTGASSILLASDFEYQNQDKETNIPASNEGGKSSLTMPSDLENPNPQEKIDMSTLEEASLHSSTVSPEYSPADASLPEFPELSPQLWAELDAYLALEESLNLHSSHQHPQALRKSLQTESLVPLSSAHFTVFMVDPSEFEFIQSVQPQDANPLNTAYALQNLQLYSKQDCSSSSNQLSVLEYGGVVIDLFHASGLDIPIEQYKGLITSSMFDANCISEPSARGLCSALCSRKFQYIRENKVRKNAEPYIFWTRLFEYGNPDRHGKGYCTDIEARLNMGPTYIRDQWLWNDELLSEVDSVRELRVDVLDIEAHRKRYKRADQSKVTSRAMSSQTPVGYGFHPTDEELVNHYLRFKMHGGYEEEVSRIPEVNVCDYEPWVLPSLSVIQSNDPECYFFCPRNYKYVNSQRINRTTEAGYWKVTGKDHKIKAKSTKEHIATKKILVFYKGRFPKGVKTNWVMHEYHPNFNFGSERDFVLCKLKKDPDEIIPTYEEGESSFNVTSGFENQNSNECYYPSTFEESEYGARMASNFTNSEPEDDSYQVQAQLQSFHGFDEGDYNLNSALQFSYGNMY